MNSATITPSIFDTGGLAALKRQTKANDPAALKAAAQQFEALFLQMVLKSMRDASPREGMFDSEQTRLYESLLDQQMGQVMASKGGTGLAALIEKQLARSATNGASDPVDFEHGLPLPTSAASLSLSLSQAARASRLPTQDLLGVPVSASPPVNAVTAPAAPPPADTTPAAGDFIGKVWPHALDAGRSTGIPAEFLVAQAALETGWGRSEPRRADGQPSYNVFGIKAGRNWTGATVEANTTEVVGGVARQQVERFRAYGSYAEAFRDYANLLSANPRYAAVLGSTDASGFAQGLQRAGYATDPAYAAKLERIINGQTLRTALLA
jgi:peptidoglycan hydrolase FlgJ